MDNEISAIVSFENPVALIRKVLRQNIGIVAELIDLAPIIEFELEVALMGSQVRPYIDKDITEIHLATHCPQTTILTELKAIIAQYVYSAIEGSIGAPKVNHEYSYGKVNSEMDYIVTDHGDYRLHDYYRLLREKNEEGLEHGDEFRIPADISRHKRLFNKPLSY